MDLSEEYLEYVDSCYEKHEAPLSQHNWLREKLSKKPTCRKCQAARKFLFREGVRIKDVKRI